MAQAKKLPSGHFRVQYYVDGKLYSVTRPTAAAANLVALTHQESNKQQAVPGKITLTEAIDEYIEAKSNILSPSTIRGYRAIQKHALPDIINLPLRKLTTKAVQQQLNKNAKKYSPKSVSNQYGLVSATLKYENVHLDDIALAPKQKPEYFIPTPEEQDEIIKAVTGKGDIELWVMFVLFMGLRPSEVRALRWENYKDGTILVKGAYVRNEQGEYVYKVQNKTYDSTRTLDVPDKLQKKLAAIQQPIGEIFSGQPNTYLAAFKRHTKHIHNGKFNIYSLRHAYASTMLLLGVPDKYTMERMGHSTDNMLKTVYQHTFKEKQQEYSERLNNHLKSFKSV